MALSWTPAKKRGVPRMQFRSTCVAPGPGAGFGSFGDVAAMVVGAPPGMSRTELYRQGMRGMGDAGLLDSLVGGKLTAVSAQLSAVERALKISTAASVVAGAIALASLLLRRK